MVSKSANQGKVRFVSFESEVCVQGFAVESMWGIRGRSNKSISEVFVLSHGNIIAAVH